MELCEFGDVESCLRNHPNKMFEPDVCRNLLFQMAFALYVATDRFHLRHYDVKLLNFFLQSAKSQDPTIIDENHPHVVLRYGVGKNIFRLRMHPSAAYIAKLADFGTSTSAPGRDGQRITPGQFTTLENTPPDFLILGNAAKQGHGHDSFGLGLCMLHLFTGNCPYEEILGDVICPKNLKEKLRNIWNHNSHDVIQSALVDYDEDGIEIEDERLYHTLYRFLVLFGIPEWQPNNTKHSKVLRAIRLTLTAQLRSKACADVAIFNRDRSKYSLSYGSDERIADARRRLQVRNQNPLFVLLVVLLPLSLTYLVPIISFCVQGCGWLDGPLIIISII